MNSPEDSREVAEPLAYEFGDFRLDVRQRLLFAHDGEPVTLPTRAFETLLFLVTHHGTLLDKATIMKAVWPKVFVAENNLNQYVSLLRRVLGETPQDHRFIVTVPGRGFRFVAAVSAVQGERAATARSASQKGPRDSLAVLPFANLTGDATRDYFGDGMAEELIHRLARVPGLRIPARTSAFVYKGRALDIRQIARELGVEAVLEGGVRMDGDRVRVTVQLVDGATGFRLWSHSTERKLGDLFRLQDELAAAVLRTLRPEVDAGVEAATQTPSTLDLQAYELYAQARAIATRPTEENLQTALRMLLLAVAKDPSFARAISALAFTRTRLLIFDYAMPGGLAEARSDAERALALDPTLTEARQVLAVVSAAVGDWVAAEENFLSADVAHDAHISSSHSIYVLQSVGHLQRALRLAVAVYRSAPFLPVAPLVLALLHTALGNDAEAARYLAATEALGYPASISVFQDVAATLETRAGKHLSASERMGRTISQGMRSVGGAEATAKVFSGIADAGARNEALNALERLYARAPADALNQTDRKRLMLWMTMLGAVDAAHDVATTSLDHYLHSKGMVGMAWGHLWLPEMRPFRAHVRFGRFAERLGMIPYWERFGAPDVAPPSQPGG
jgi:TolB-like protein